MKQLFKILMFASLALPTGGCEVETEPIVVLPNVALNDSGMTIVPTISIYQNDAYQVTLARTEGLSKAAEFDVVLDQALLDEYNELNGSSYVLMPASCYTIGTETIAFAEKAKTASFGIQFKPEALIAAAGSVAQAENCVIPFSCLPKTTVNSQTQKLGALVRFSYTAPTVIVDAPTVPAELTFIYGVVVPRKLTLECRSNFTTLQTSKLAFASTQQMVDEYNTANRTEYRLLPADCYTVGAGAFDVEALTLSYDITLEASRLDAEYTYLLPLKVASNDYTVSQDNVYYVKVSIQEIQFSVSQTEPAKAATKLKHAVSIDVRLNGALADDVPIEFTYDANKIAAYNAAAGTNYGAFDASKIAVTNATMTAGSVKATAKVEVDMSGSEFDDGKVYVLPFVLDKSKLPEGSIMMTDEVVYVLLKRTLYGKWNNRTNDDYVTGTSGWTQNNYMKAVTNYYSNYVDKGWKHRYCNNYYSWGRGFHWYVAWDEVYNGDPNKRKVHAFSGVTSGFSDEQNRDLVMDQGSYYDLVEGKVWFNFQYYYNADDQKNDKRQTIKCYLESPLTVTEF